MSFADIALLFVCFFLVLGAIVTLIGCVGLLRLPNFYQRIHGPSVSITFGAGGILLASMIYFSSTQARPIVHELLITMMVFLTAPVVNMLLMRAAVYRDLMTKNITLEQLEKTKENNS